ncbi:MAG: glycoside hydrolase family 125 protein, partial [Epsilonproteobacteria bacterium]|nr:glycoside hydrolase family 125 protein [Campylobacterota bacterium]
MTADTVNELLRDKGLSKGAEDLLKEVRKSINKNALTEYMLIDLSREILKR